MRRVRVLLGVLLLAAAAGGCSPLYVLRAGYVEAKVLWRREPIARVLAAPDLDPATRGKLEIVLAARAFATDLGLDVGGSFTTLSYLDDDHSIYVLTAASRGALTPYTWWFPVVGRLPYKGFFEREDAMAQAARLEADGWDTYVRRAAAFSTLGWFDDPLLRQQLKHGERFLVDLVLHESYHATFYLPGAEATAFNESLATFVGRRGAIAFFAGRPDAAAWLEEAEHEWEDDRRFGRIVDDLADRLRAYYAEGATDPHGRDALFAEARDALAAAPFHARGWATALGPTPNNAVLMHHLLYATGLDLFEEVFARTGSLRAALDLIEPAARAARLDPFGAVRRRLDAPADVRRDTADAAG